MSGGEIERLPDPELFRDAVYLARHGTIGPRDLDEMDALLLALVQRLQDVKVG